MRVAVCVALCVVVCVVEAICLSDSTCICLLIQDYSANPQRGRVAAKHNVTGQGQTSFAEKLQPLIGWCVHYIGLIGWCIHYTGELPTIRIHTPIIGPNFSAHGFGPNPMARSSFDALRLAAMRAHASL